MFKKLYNIVLKYAAKPQAEKYLKALCFAESSFFPVPPDVMLAPMTMAKPDHAWRYAWYATVFSVLGGILGYILGYFAYKTIVIPMFDFFGHGESYLIALEWFKKWGILVVAIAAFTPLPYKLFTIGAGVLQMNLFLFVLISIFGRGARFFIVCGLFKISNKYLADFIQKWINIVGWGILFIILIICYYFY